MRTIVRVTAMSLLVALAGCGAVVNHTAGTLTQAGFRAIPADTPQRAEELKALPAHQLTRRPTGGNPSWVYADPSYCKCLYVGSDDNYATYQALLRQQDAAREYEEGLKRMNTPNF